MTIYYHRTCDRRGRILREERHDAGGVHDAMAQASDRICTMARLASGLFDPRGRIEIADGDGCPVARVYCAEVLPASANPLFGAHDRDDAMSASARS